MATGPQGRHTLQYILLAHVWTDLQNWKHKMLKIKFASFMNVGAA